jgi:hypothetical protein
MQAPDAQEVALVEGVTINWRTQTVMDTMQDLVDASLAQRSGRQGKQGVVPLLDKPGE